MGWFKKDKDEELEEKQNPNSEEEEIHVAGVIENKVESEGGVREKIKTNWSDEYLCLKGLQWDMSQAPRSADKKSKRYNIVLNVCLPTIMNIVDALTASTPEADVSGRDASDKQTALKLSDLISFIFYRNVFEKQWRDIVMQGVHYGPFIASVEWDPDFMGGSGPSRWVGEVSTKCVKKDEIFFDPAIIDLEENLQDCRYIQQRYRKYLSYIKNRWDNGKYAVADVIEDTDVEEGVVSKRATVIKQWERGTPAFISEEDKEKYLDKAAKATDSYKKKMYEDMATGELEGIHCSYSVGTVFLEYNPYVYEDGLYPFAYAVLYQDEKNPYGYGEMRNIVPIQVAYNFCAEIEMASAAVEGLGGGYYNKGSISKPQHDEMMDTAYVHGAWHEVMSKDGMKSKEGTQTPQSLVLFKDFLKQNIDTVTQNTAIQQGVSPGANVPFASIKELGTRADVRNKGKMNIIERLMKQYMPLIISRIGQFYDDEREYRIRGNKSMAIKTVIYDGIQQLIELEDPQKQLAGMIEILEQMKNMDPNSADEYGSFSNKEMKKTWIRNEDEKGEPDYVAKEEEYIADYDVKVKLSDERPTSRNYYEQVAMQMFGIALGPKAFWSTLDSGKFPPVDEILQELKELQQQSEQTTQTPPQTSTPQSGGGNGGE